MDEKNKRKLIDRIEAILEEINKLLDDGLSLTDIKIVEKSKELDELLLRFYVL